MFKLPPFEIKPVPTSMVRAMAVDTKDWGYRYMNPDVFHTYSFTGQGVVVFIIDTGIDDRHPDLQGKVIYRKDFTGEGDRNLNPHGSWCASRVAANPNGVGVVGMAPNAMLGDIRVLDSQGSGSNLGVANGIRDAVDAVLPEPYQNWRRVLSMSLGSPVPSKSVEAALQYAAEKGVFVICAAGNDGNESGRDTMGYPARYPEAIAVGAIDEDERLAWFSSVGENLDVVAPGVDLLGAIGEDEYAYFSGTSMATPGVAAAAALILERFGGQIKTQYDLERYLTKYAKDLGVSGHDAYFGAGAVIMDNYIDMIPDESEEPPVEEPPVDEPPAEEPPAEGVMEWWHWALIGFIGAAIIWSAIKAFS